MASKPATQAATTIKFDTASLFRADGFESGDILRPPFPDMPPGELRELLAQVIDRYLLPQLDQKVRVMILPSTRNPVRATSVNGESVAWATAETGVGRKVTPSTVNISIEQIETCVPKHKTKAALPDEHGAAAD